jgi:hypothetical protein
MHRLIRCCFYISLISAALPVWGGVDIAGIHIADSYPLGGQSLRLNGAGVRSKIFIKVYIGTLYLAETTSSVEQVLQSPGPKSMQMSILYKEIEAEKIAQGWSDGFAANLSADQLQQMAPRLKQFNALFPALKKGDHVYMDFVPGEGTVVKINNDMRGHVEGADFFRALLQVWIGNHPADKHLKHGLLGG